MTMCTLLDSICEAYHYALVHNQTTQMQLLRDIDSQFPLVKTHEEERTNAPETICMKFRTKYSNRLIKSTFSKIGYECVSKKPNALEGFTIRQKSSRKSA